MSILTRAEAEALSKRVLSYATADETRITIRSSMRSNTRFAVNQISTAGDNTDAVVTVRSVFGKRAGTASTNKLDEVALKAVVSNAETLAKLSPEDPEAVPELDPQQYPEPRGWSDVTAQLDPATRTATVRMIAGPAQEAGLVATGYLEAIANSLAIANSKGLFAYSRNTNVALTTTVRAPDGSSSGWAGSAHWDWTRIDPRAIAETAIQKARAAKDAVAIEPGRYTVVLEPTAVGNLVQLIRGPLDARSADEGRSFFSKTGGGNKLGMKVADDRVTLFSDPGDPDIYGDPFLSDGLPLSRTVWIENGIVKNLAYDRYWAQKQGKQPNSAGGGGFFGGGAGGFKMVGGDATLQELIAGTQRGILVTRFWYIRAVDPRTILYTGLTRDGTFLIENGKVTHAIKNMRFNESPIFMLNNLEAMSQSMRVSASEGGDAGAAIVMPAIRTHDFTFTSLSDAI